MNTKFLRASLSLLAASLASQTALAEITATGGPLLINPKDLNRSQDMYKQAATSTVELGQELSYLFSVGARFSASPFAPRVLGEYLTAKSEILIKNGSDKIIASQKITAVGIIGGPTWEVSLGSDASVRFHADVGAQIALHEWKVTNSNLNLATSTAGLMKSTVILPVLQLGQALTYKVSSQAAVQLGGYFRFSRIQGFKIATAEGAWADQKNETFTYSGKPVPMDLSGILFNAGFSYAL